MRRVGGGRAFHDIEGYAYGFTGFFLLLELGVGILPRKVEELSARSKVKGGRFDFLGVIWLLSVPFGPLLGWILTNAFGLTESNWRLLFGARVTLTIVVPLVCVLPLLRYVRGRAASFALGVLALGTAFPVLTGIQPAIDLIRGPEWETVRVSRTEDFSVDLSDGRKLAHSEEMSLHPGAMDILVLRASRYILDVH